MKPPETRHSVQSFLALVYTFVATLLLVLAFLGCNDTSGQSATTSLSTMAGDTVATEYQVVQFNTEDGVALGGRLYGTGSRGVLLAHMFPADQTSWSAQAAQLAGQGYLVLTFDFRGYGKSQGSKDIQYLDRDVTAAVMYLRTAGAEEVILVGASMGGTACLKAAQQLQALSSIRVAGVATFSAPVEFRGLSAREAVPDIVIPMLFVAAEGDTGAAGARELEALSGDRGDLQILPGGDHGTDLFTGSQATTAWQLLLAFVQQNF
jgi:alpha/beta superfamily hydrolase